MKRREKASQFNEEIKDGMFTHRGLEVVVHALYDLRQRVAPHVPAMLADVLELADWIGLERAVSLTTDQLDELFYQLPKEIWDRVAAHATNLPNGVAAFQHEDGFSWTMADVVGWIGDGLSKASQESAS